jgi:thiosulfate dehydrogenase (quinone) large subunit
LRDDEKDRRIAYALLRILLGANIFMHGVSRLMAGPAVFTAKITEQFARAPLPHWSLVGFAVVLPWLEALLGLLLLLGLWTRFALIAGSLLILVLTFGVTLVQEWGIAGLQLIYAIAYAALIFLRSYNAYSIDGAIAKNAP